MFGVFTRLVISIGRAAIPSDRRGAVRRENARAGERGFARARRGPSPGSSESSLAGVSPYSVICESSIALCAEEVILFTWRGIEEARTFF